MPLAPPAILSQSGFFMGVPDRSFDRLVAMALMRKYSRGEIIFREGEPCPGVFVIGEGSVRVYKISPAGREHVLHLVGPGGTFAEVAAIGNFDCPAFAEALEDTTCVLLPTGAFTKALREDHEMCLGLMTSMAAWVKRLVGQVEDIALRDAAGRVARYLLSVADPKDGSVKLPSLKRHLASHLNLTSETLSRTLRRLAENGMIQSDGDDLAVTDRASLSEVAEGIGPVI